MIEAALRKTIEQFSDIVEFIEKLELSEEEHVSKVKAKLKLFDGTALWIRELKKEILIASGKGKRTYYTLYGIHRTTGSG